MHNRYLKSILLLAVLPVYAASNEGSTVVPPTGGSFGKAPVTTTRKVKEEVGPAAATSPAVVSSTTLRTVIARDAIVPANGSVAFDWGVDLSGADKVGLSVTTLDDSNSRLTKVRIGVMFASPGDWYVLTDVILGSSFFYIDHGGATVPVYGPNMRVLVFNDGTTPVQITQLSAYAVVR